MHTDFRERGEGRERWRGRKTSPWERNIDWLPHTCLTGDRSLNQGMCPDRELNFRPFSLWDDTLTSWATLTRANDSLKKNKNTHFHLFIDFQLTHGHRLTLVPFINLVHYILLNIFNCVFKFNVFTFEYFKRLAQYPDNINKQNSLKHLAYFCFQ